MPKIHPSLIIRMDIDAREYSHDLELDIKRNYNHVATTFVEPREPESDDLENTLRMDVVLHRAYWDPTPENDALWSKDLVPWLRNAMYKVENNVKAENATRRNHAQKPLDFTWTEVRFGDHMRFAFKTDEDSSIPLETAQRIGDMRRMLNSGDLGEGAACVRVPSKESFEEQRDAAYERMRAQEEKAGSQEGDEDAVPEAKGDNAAAMGDVAPEQCTEQASDAGQPVAEGAGAVDGGAANEDQTGEPPRAVHVNFTPDTTVWGIEYADGSTRQYDTSLGEFIE